MTVLCKNCRHCFDSPPITLPALWPGALCVAPGRTQFNHEVGQRAVVLTCKTARKDVQDCGPDGAGYVPKLRVRLVAFLQSILGARHAS